jgi:hypothetical protein
MLPIFVCDTRKARGSEDFEFRREQYTQKCKVGERKTSTSIVKEKLSSNDGYVTNAEFLDNATGAEG